MASQTGMAAPAIAALVGSVESHVGKVIHAFTEEGLDSLDPTVVDPASRVGHAASTLPVYVQRNGWAVRL